MIEMNLKKYILDIEDYIKRGRVKILPLRENSKIPIDNGYFDKEYSFDELQSYGGNFGIVAGANHTDCSLAIIDIDGYTLPSSENKTRVAEVKQETKDFIFECLKDIPDAMHVRTQSGGYHIYLWNKTVSDKIHETSNNLCFPADFEIPELVGKSLAHSIEIFTKEGTKQCVLPGSTILDEATGNVNTYEVISDINKLSDIGVVEDINATVKETLIEHGFLYNETNAEKEFITLEPSDSFKTLSNDEIDTVAQIIIPILKSCNGSKHQASLCIGGYFSKNISKDSAAAICDVIIEEIGYIFNSSRDFKKTVLSNYDRDCKNKQGLPSLIAIIKNHDVNFNEKRFYFDLNMACKNNYNHNIVSDKPSTNRITYLSINYRNNKITTFTWNKDKKNEDIYYTNTHDILNLSPITIYESYNILDTNASPQLCLTFYRNGMPSAQTIKGDDIESLEKQLARRPGIVLKPREYKGVLNQIINEFIDLDLLTINEEIPIEGIFINPITKTLCRRDDKCNTEIKKPSKESVQEGLEVWSKLKDVYPGDKTKLSHIIRYGLICPFSYIFKTEYQWIRLLYLYGPSRTSKTTLAEIALSPYTSISEEISIGGGSFDTPYRIGKALSRQGTGVIINEPSPNIEKGEPREIIKRSVESKYSREKDEKGEHVKIPAYSNMIFTANSFIPTHDAFVRRSQYLEFTKNDRLSDDDIKTFNDTFHHKNWHNTDFLKLRAIGDFIVWYISENLDVLESEHTEIINSMLDVLLEYADEDKDVWDWLYQDAELMDIESADNEILNQFRRLALHDHNRINGNTYLPRLEDEDESSYLDRVFKETFIDAVKRNSIYYLHYQKINDDDYIIVNTSIKDALNDFCVMQVTCKGLAGYMNKDYTTISYKGKSIKGFRLKWGDFKSFLDISE